MPLHVILTRNRSECVSHVDDIVDDPCENENGQESFCLRASEHDSGTTTSKLKGGELVNQRSKCSYWSQLSRLNNLPVETAHVLFRSHHKSPQLFRHSRREVIRHLQVLDSHKRLYRSYHHGNLLLGVCPSAIWTLKLLILPKRVSMKPISSKVVKFPRQWLWKRKSLRNWVMNMCLVSWTLLLCTWRVVPNCG